MKYRHISLWQCGIECSRNQVSLPVWFVCVLWIHYCMNVCTFGALSRIFHWYAIILPSPLPDDNRCVGSPNTKFPVPPLSCHAVCWGRGGSLLQPWCVRDGRQVQFELVPLLASPYKHWVTPCSDKGCMLSELCLYSNSPPACVCVCAPCLCPFWASEGVIWSPLRQTDSLITWCYFP